MSETSVKIEVRMSPCQKLQVQRSHCKVWLRACSNLLQPPPYISVFWGCGRLLHALNHTLQWLLVSTVFGMVSSIFNDFYTCIRESVDSLCRDGADMPRPSYIGKSCTRPNLEDLSLFRYLTIVYESLCTQ